MFCYKCGNKIVDGAVFCQKCGMKLVVDEPAQQMSDESVSAVMQKPSVSAPPIASDTSVITMPIADSQNGNKSEAVIHSYAGNYMDMAIKIYCNGQYVDSIRKGGMLTVPISTDSLLEFKCAFRKTSFSVKSGEYRELKLDFNPSSGKLLVFDVNSGSYAEEQAKLTKSRKSWVKFAVIAIILGMVLSGISYVIRNTEKSAEQDIPNVPAYAEQTDILSVDNSTTIPQGNNNQFSANSENSNQGEVLYEDIPVSQYFYCTEDDLKNALGVPDYEGYAYAGYCYEYDGTEFIIDEAGVTLIWARNPILFTVDGITLDKNQAELIAALGEPNYQGWDYNEGLDVFEIQYTQLETPLPVLLTFRMSDPNEKASLIIIRPYTADSDDVYGYEGDAGGYNSGFRRADYFTGLNQADLLRYPDNHLYSKVYFSGYTVNNVMEPRVYLVRNGNNYLIIDDRNGSGANTVDNDKVSVYGTFYGNQTISFTDGRNQQVPHIIVDKLVINSILPQDPDDFAQAYVETVNRYSKAWSDENEYLSGTKVKLILGSSNVAGVSDYFMPVEAEVFTSFYVDGYSIPFFNVVIDGEPIGGGWSGSYGKMDKLPITVEKGKLYVVVGNLELLFGMDGSSHARLHFESIEPYE